MSEPIPVHVWSDIACPWCFIGKRRFEDTVSADIAQARASGINGVPFYVIDNRFGVSGAQAPETFTAALTQAAQAQHGTASAGAAS